MHLFINLKIFLFCTSCTIKYGLRERKIYYPIRPYINCAEQALIKIPRAISVCKIFETQHVILGVAIVVRNKKIVFVIKDFLRWELFYEYMYVSNSAYLNSRGWSTLGKFPLSSKHAPPLNGSSVQGIMEGWSSGITGNCAFVQVGCLSWRERLYQEPSWTT